MNNVSTDRRGPLNHQCPTTLPREELQIARHPLSGPQTMSDIAGRDEIQTPDPGLSWRFGSVRTEPPARDRLGRHAANWPDRAGPRQEPRCPPAHCHGPIGQWVSTGRPRRRGVAPSHPPCRASDGFIIRQSGQSRLAQETQRHSRAADDGVSKMPTNVL